MDRLTARRRELRTVTDADLDTFYVNQLDPVANHMAAFTAKDPADRDAFDAHWSRIMGDDKVVIKTVVVDGQVAGHVAKFELFGKSEITYWLGRAYWGKGLATWALAMFLRAFGPRPLYARAAKDNVASCRVLERCGFGVTGYDSGFANARGEEIEEVVYRLD